MKTILTRRDFLKTVAAGTAGLGLLSAPVQAAGKKAFSFGLLGDLHFDKLQHHDLDWLKQEKPNDVNQVQNYTMLTRELLPQLFTRLRERIAGLDHAAFVAQTGDLVEGLCGSEKLAIQQNTEAVEFVRQANLGVPFLLTKGNHDVTGPGAPAAFSSVFHPFLKEQSARLNADCNPTRAMYQIQQEQALFCFMDAYDKECLPWLEAALARRTARHCFVLLHPPVVPYGARSTWHLFSHEKEKAQRERLLELLGKHNAFVLTGHIHKFNTLVRTTAQGGRFLQFATSSVLTAAEPKPLHHLTGLASYNADQVKVEPDFSPGTEAQRRAVYKTEAPFVKHFEYADLPGYGTVTVDGDKVTARVYPGLGRRVWQEVPLSKLLEA